ncbi:MAG: hypothetical protein IPL51_05810 [Candidatus Competibacteraceae bacterium]|nr:hypothetical protein [Candidatus Competibacteraceae bacterium]
MRITIDRDQGSAAIANPSTPLLQRASPSPWLAQVLRAFRPSPAPLLAQGDSSHIAINAPAQSFASQLERGAARFSGAPAPTDTHRAAPAPWRQRAAERAKAWLALGKQGAIGEGLAKEGTKLTTVTTQLTVIHAACKANEGAIGGLIGASGALGLVSEVVKARKTQAEIDSGREQLSHYQTAERGYASAARNYEKAKVEYELALAANKQAAEQKQPPHYGAAFLNHLETQLKTAGRNLTQASDGLRSLEASRQLGQRATAQASERQAVHGVSLGTSASTVVAGALKGIAPAVDVAAKGLNAAGAGFLGVAAVASVPLSARALAKDVSDYRKNADFDAAVQRQIEAHGGPDGDPTLAAIAKLVHERTETKGKVVSAIKNALGIGSGLAAGVASSAAIAAAAGVTAAAAVASIATPVGWALAGATAAVAIGYGLWKLGKYLHQQHQQQQLERLASGQGKHFEQRLGALAIARDIDLNSPHQRAALAAEIKNDAQQALHRNSPRHAAATLLDRLRANHDQGRTERFLRALNVDDADLRTLLHAADNNDAITLLMKKLNLA